MGENDFYKAERGAPLPDKQLFQTTDFVKFLHDYLCSNYNGALRVFVDGEAFGSVYISLYRITTAIRLLLENICGRYRISATISCSQKNITVVMTPHTAPFDHEQLFELMKNSEINLVEYKNGKAVLIIDIIPEIYPTCYALSPIDHEKLQKLYAHR